ncbi:MAG: sulfate adenylyltransferase [Thermodesulfobacteria bacterium]|nr:sulfate adenylyltransferase [Thermodesulfobacteriota bacterium]
MALVNPHGSQKKLMPLLLKGAEREDEVGRAKAMKKINISSRESGDILMLGMGAFTPLNGFMCKDDYDGCVEEMKLRQVDPGTMWPLPVTLAVDEDVRKEIKEGDEVALHDSDTGELMATMKIEEIWEPDKRKECELCFKGSGPDSERFWEVAEKEHPGVQQVLNSGKYYVGGPIKALSEKDFVQKYGEAYMHPEVSRKIFEDRGWSTVAAFQTRNPIHRSHEYLTKIAQEVLDGVFIHALVGKLKPGDIPGEWRMKCYKALLDNYYNMERTVLGVYPLEMRYGGPKEALLHGVFRQNFGCSHLIIGRDHAGVGDFYGLFEAQEIYDKLWDGALELQPLKIDWTFWCHKCGGMASLKTCPHDKEDRVVVSGTKFRRLMSEGKIDEVPPEFSRPEVLKILAEYYSDPEARKVKIKKGAFEDLK